jgi:O-antigen ligase
VIACFLFLLFISPGYKFFKQTIAIGLLASALLFIYLQPNLSLIKNNFTPRSTRAIKEVMRSNALLQIDGNTTWRLVIWNQILVDKFPANLFGIGFGTPMLKAYPIDDYSKLATLPYVMGGHNSFIYLFGRLGIPFLLLITLIYITIFKEYFYHKSYYYSTNQILIFWSFFAITVMALFNPILESPMFASGYWMLLGFIARCIYNRNSVENKSMSAL